MSRTIISDTSCLIAFDRINQVDILYKVFDSLLTTTTVQQEYGKPLPSWITIEDAIDLNKQAELERLVDRGEASAIALALEKQNSILIVDEKKGRNLARSLNIEIIGSLKILLMAKQKGVLPSIYPLIQELEKQGFRFSKSIIEQLLLAANETRQDQ